MQKLQENRQQEENEEAERPVPTPKPQKKAKAAVSDNKAEDATEKSEDSATIAVPPTHGTPRDFSRGDENNPRIALTFDAGASAAPCSKILDVLAKHSVHATFFLTGKWVEANPELARRIADEGHEIGNHTYSHRRLTKLSDGDITIEVRRTERLVQEQTGRSTKPLLRVPYGDRNARVLSVLAELGYRSIYWDLDSWDSVKKGITSSEIEERVTGKVRNGSVVLLHCGSQATANSLDKLFDRLTTSGYQPVKVSELIQQ